MGKGAIFIGIAWIIFAFWLFYVSKSWIAFGINFAIGLALILFWKEEGKVEQRKDIKIEQTKK